MPVILLGLLAIIAFFVWRWALTAGRARRRPAPRRQAPAMPIRGHCVVIRDLGQRSS